MAAAASGGSLHLTAAALKHRTGAFELEDIRHLHLNGLSISSISSAASALLQCTNLITLDLRKNDIKSLEGIDALEQLEMLDVSENKIASLAPIAKLSALRELHVASNAIVDAKQLEHLKSLPNLRILTMGPGRSNAITVAERHIPVLLDMLPSLVVLDGQSTELLKACREHAKAAKAGSGGAPSTDEPTDLRTYLGGPLSSEPTYMCAKAASAAETLARPHARPFNACMELSSGLLGKADALLASAMASSAAPAPSKDAT